jgi:hypothetical protein
LQPANVPALVIYAGDTWSQSYEFKAGDPAEAIDFVAEGWTDWICQCRATPESTQFFTINVDDSDAENGRIVLYADPEETRLFTPGVFDLQSTNGVTIKTWIRGNLSWVEDVSR